MNGEIDTEEPGTVEETMETQNIDGSSALYPLEIMRYRKQSRCSEIWGQDRASEMQEVSMQVILDDFRTQIERLTELHQPGCE
jgi:hypothetical protein